MGKKTLILVLVSWPLAFAYAQIDIYAGRTTENDGLGKYERINIIERQVLAIEDKLKTANSPMKEIELLQTQMQELKKQMDSLNELTTLKEEVQRLARKSAQLEVELALLKNKGEPKIEILPTPLPIPTIKEEAGK